MTGIHLLNTGEVEANLLHLDEHFKLTFIDELVASKTAEKVAPPGLDWTFHAARLDELERQLEAAFDASQLPEERDRQSVNDLLIRLRLGDEPHSTIR